jgi:hypothetical protein
MQPTPLPSTSSEPPSTSGELLNAHGEPLSTDGPLVIDVEVTRKKRKKRYTRGLRDLQTTNRGMARASRRLVRAVARGISTYIKESDKSARKKRDGALRDAGLNMADALGTSLREISGIPRDVAKTLSTKGWRKATRRTLKASARFNRRLLRVR